MTIEETWPQKMVKFAAGLEKFAAQIREYAQDENWEGMVFREDIANVGGFVQELANEYDNEDKVMLERLEKI